MIWCTMLCADFYSFFLSLFLLIFSLLTKRANEEIERFQMQKKSDLQESLANYVMLQLKLSKMVLPFCLTLKNIYIYGNIINSISKQGLQTWKNVKEALQELP